LLSLTIRVGWTTTELELWLNMGTTCPSITSFQGVFHMCQYCTVAFPPAAALAAELADVAVAALPLVVAALAAVLLVAVLLVAALLAAAVAAAVDVAVVVLATLAPQAASKDAPDTARAATPA
jgi:hypothetical protein